jgi:hypothetical protein
MLCQNGFHCSIQIYFFAHLMRISFDNLLVFGTNHIVQGGSVYKRGWGCSMGSVQQPLLRCEQQVRNISILAQLGVALSEEEASAPIFSNR